MSDALTPEREAELREYQADVSSWMVNGAIAAEAVGDLFAEIDRLRAALSDRDRQLAELREVCERIKKVCWWLMDAPHEDYQEAVNQFATKLADAVDIPKRLAALLPPTAKEKNDAE